MLDLVEKQRTKIISLEKILDQSKTRVVFYERNTNADGANQEVTVKSLNQYALTKMNLSLTEEINLQDLQAVGEIEMTRVEGLNEAKNKPIESVKKVRFEGSPDLPHFSVDRTDRHQSMLIDSMLENDRGSIVEPSAI